MSGNIVVSCVAIGFALVALIDCGMKALYWRDKKRYLDE